MSTRGLLDLRGANTQLDVPWEPRATEPGRGEMSAPLKAALGLYARKLGPWMVIFFDTARVQRLLSVQRNENGRALRGRTCRTTLWEVVCR